MKIREKLKKNIAQKLITSILIMVLLLAAIITGTLANINFQQHKTGVASGSQYYPIEVLLNKYERDKTGKETTNPIKGALFALFKVDQNGLDQQVGTLYETNIQGQILIEDGLDPGNYYFKEIVPAYSYTFDMEQEESDHKYHFEIPFIEEPSQVKLKVVNAYNPRRLKALSISKWVENSDGTPLSKVQTEETFTFLIHLGDEEEDVYPFTIYDDAKALVEQGEIRSNDAVMLSHGQRLVIEDLPLGLSYDIEEELVEGYTVISNNHRGNISAEQEEVNFRNVFQMQNTGCLRIDKTVLGNEINKETDFIFQVYFSDNGTYSYQKGGESISFTSGDTLSIKDEEQVVFKGLPIGLGYQVVELEEEGYISGVGDISGNIIQAGATASFYNYDETHEDGTGNLRIQKDVTGVENGKQQIFAFKIEFTGSAKVDESVNDQETNANDQETNANDQETNANDQEISISKKETSISKQEESINKQGAGINNQEELEKASINNQEELEEKSLNHQEELKEDGYRYRINDGEEQWIKSGDTLMLQGGEQAVITGIPEGMKYGVTESDYSEIGYISSISRISGTILGEMEIPLHFVNEKQAGEDPPETDDNALITVRKVVLGETPVEDQEKAFQFTLWIDGEPREFQLKNQEEIGFKVPIGSFYKVEEMDDQKDGYVKTSITNGYGTVPEGQVEVVQTNTYVGTIYKHIQGEKTWDISANPSMELPDYVTLYLKDKDIRIASVEVRADENGKWKYEFKVPKYDIKGNEILYVLEEEPVSGYESVVQGYHIKNILLKPKIEDEAEKDYPLKDSQSEERELITTDSEQMKTKKTYKGNGNQSKPMIHDRVSPITQDDTQILLWGALTSISLGTISLICYLKKRKDN